MDTDDLSIESYEGILIEAEKLTHDLTLHFGVLSGDCKNETEYIDKAEKLTKEIIQVEDWELDDLFWGNPPDKEKLKLALFGTFLIISLSKCQSQKLFDYPVYYLDKLELLPDLTMTDKGLDLPDGGGYFCGPVSVANSFIYLQRNGFEKLLTDYQKNDFVELKLHSSDFKADNQNFKNHYELMDFDCTNGADNIFLSGALRFKLKK
jgi:hypothetical protein